MCVTVEIGCDGVICLYIVCSVGEEVFVSMQPLQVNVADIRQCADGRSDSASVDVLSIVNNTCDVGEEVFVSMQPLQVNVADIRQC